MSRYTIIILATRRVDSDRQIRVCAHAVDAESLGDALGKATLIGQKLYPGWQVHPSVVPLDLDVVTVETATL